MTEFVLVTEEICNHVQKKCIMLHNVRYKFAIVKKIKTKKMSELRICKLRILICKQTEFMEI